MKNKKTLILSLISIVIVCVILILGAKGCAATLERNKNLVTAVDFYQFNEGETKQTVFCFYDGIMYFFISEYEKDVRNYYVDNKEEAMLVLQILEENNYIKEDGEKKKITADELKERIEAYEFKESGD